MEDVFVLLVTLAGVSHGIETFCDATQDGAQCYATLGGNVYLQLMNYSSGWEISLKKEIDHESLLIMENNKLVSRGPIASRLEFYINNRTLRISDTEKNDSAAYVLYITDPDTGDTDFTELQLFIEAPVSCPQLSSECLSQGGRRVSCSSEGDSLQYNWIMDRHMLSASVVPSGKETNVVTLKRGSSGDLICTVKNHVSSAAAHLNISPCPGLLWINGYVERTLCFKPTTANPNTQALTTPASSPQLSSECHALSDALSGAVDLHGDNEDTVSLKKGIVGSLACMKNKEAKDMACGNPGFSVYVYVQLAEVVTLLAVCLGLSCYYKMKTRPQELLNTQDGTELQESRF